MPLRRSAISVRPCGDPWGDTPSIRNRLFLGPYKAPKGTNTKVTSAKGHFCADPTLRGFHRLLAEPPTTRAEGEGFRFCERIDRYITVVVMFVFLPVLLFVIMFVFYSSSCLGTSPKYTYLRVSRVVLIWHITVHHSMLEHIMA